MVAALRTAAGKQPHSRFVTLGTRPARADHWFAKMLNPAAGRYSQVHAADDADDIGNPAEWIKANPSLLHMPDLRQAIQAEAEQAQHDPALLASFRALRLNLGTSETADRDMLISPELWVELLKLPEAPPEGRRIWGCDLGGASAMSAICCVWGTGRLQSVAMVGREPDLQSRALRDGAGDLYQTAYDTGELLISNKRIPNIQQLFEEAEARFGGRPDALVVDRWRLAELRDALDDTSSQAVRLIVRGQGFRDGAEDVRAWSKAVVEGRVNPVQPARLLTHALSEAVVITDAAGNSKLAQNTEGGRRKRARDDVAAAAVLAVANAGLDRDQAPRPRHLWGPCLMAGKAGRRVYRTKRWQQTRRAVFERDRWRCVKCGRMGLIECDHIDPIRKQGDWFDMANLQCLCRNCHIRKSAGEHKTRVVSPARAALMEIAINGVT